MIRVTSLYRIMIYASLAFAVNALAQAPGQPDTVHRLVAASDACSTRAIRTSADVQVSDGSGFATDSFFQSADHAAIRHFDEGMRTIAVEGPLAWTSSGEQAELGSGFLKLFALGHQFHAFLLHFGEIAGNVQPVEQLAFGGNVFPALSGNYPYGGMVHLVSGDSAAQPRGLRFDFPGGQLIEAAFDDWRNSGGLRLPFRIQIDDGDRIFDYRYREIDVDERSPLWFFDAVNPPALDELLIHRLHRKMLAAHCLGDADLLSGLSAPEVIMAGRGEVSHTTREEIRERFTSTFDVLNYTAYLDTAPAVIEVAQSADIGWITVQVNAQGVVVETGVPFDDHWAWTMLLRKHDGAWLHAGNASNRRP